MSVIFRGQPIPDYAKSKHDKVKYVLTRYRDSEPISNGEFIYELNFSRFGSSIHNLRQEGWDIVTLPSKKKGLCFYYLRSLPTDVEKEVQLRLVPND